jgi:ABC exporter DevB family membrane fusion protein
MKRWKGLTCLAAAASAVSLAALDWSPGGSSPAPVPGERRPEADGPGAIEGIGFVEPLSVVRQLVPKGGGVIKACYVKAGDGVRKGDVLLALHDEKEAAAVALARRQLEVARAEEAQVRSGINPHRIKAAEKAVARLRAEWQHATREADRNRRLVPSGAISQGENDATDSKQWQLQAALHEAEAELLHLKNHVRDVDVALAQAKGSQAEANLAVAEQQLLDLRVLAPCDGTVLRLLKRPGEGVPYTEPQPVLLFGDLSRLRVRAEIDERFVKDLRVGQGAEAYGRNLLGKASPGTVVEVERMMGDKTLFTHSSWERKALHVLQVVIEMEPGFSAPVGLQVDVRVFPSGGTNP